MSKHRHNWQLAKFTASRFIEPLGEKGLVLQSAHALWLCICGKQKSVEYKHEEMVAELPRGVNEP